MPSIAESINPMISSHQTGNTNEQSTVAIGHPTGNQNFRQVAAALCRANVDGFIGTCLQTKNLIRHCTKILPRSIVEELRRRSFPEHGRASIRTRPYRECGRLLAKSPLGKLLGPRMSSQFSIDAVYHDFDHWMSEQLVDHSHVYAYEDSAFHCFEKASNCGIRRVYDLPIAYWKTLRTLLGQEAERLPHWAGTLGGGLGDSQEKLDRKTQEIELAQLVVVPSDFVADSLPRNDSQLRCIAPFGSPPVIDEISHASILQEKEHRIRGRHRLRVLFVGSMTQRKGLADLIAAVQKLDQRTVELVVLGSLQESREFYYQQCPGLRLESSRPHSQVLKLMQSCDVFCLPSIVEGRALVVQEAMSQGLPVVITNNTGAGDVVEFDNDDANERTRRDLKAGQCRRGRTGFVVPIRQSDALADVLSWSCDNRNDLLAMGVAAREKAATYSWQTYGDKIVQAVQSVGDKYLEV